jgi:hypothetical protein
MDFSIVIIIQTLEEIFHFHHHQVKEIPRILYCSIKGNPKFLEFWSSTTFVVKSQRELDARNLIELFIFITLKVKEIQPIL